MIIYPQELTDGIGELVKSKASVSYDMPILHSNAEFSEIAVANLDQVVGNYFKRDIDTLDLHPIHSVLVSMAWNKNDDIFTKEQAWPARYSPENKPFNLMHNQTDIIGHITKSFAVDKSFARIDDSLDTNIIPVDFHIITAGVIYKYWEDPKLQQRMNKIVAEIKEGNKWFVSMECLFRGFDYGVIKANGESSIIERNEHTSALTKYLRAYGGPGVYNGHKIGRVLKDITFSGKGLVNNPANPESIILNNFDSTYANLGYVNSMNHIGGDSMSEVETLKAEILDLKTKLESQKSSALLEQIAALKTDLDKSKSLATELETAKDKDKKFWEDKEKEEDKEKADLKARVDELAKSNDYMNKELDEFKKASKKTKREAALKNYDVTSVEKLVADTLELGDEAFASLVATLDGVVEAKTKKEKEDGAVQPTGNPKPNLAETKDKEDMKKDKEMDKDCSAKIKEVTADPVNVITTATEEAHANLGVSVSNEFTEFAKAVDVWYKSKKGETK